MMMQKSIEKNLKDVLKEMRPIQKWIMKKRLGNCLNDYTIIYRNGKARQLGRAFERCSIEIRSDRRFQHWIDEKVVLYQDGMVIGNMPPDYSLIIECSLQQLKKRVKRNSELITVLNGIEKYIDRIIIELKQQQQTNNIRNSLRYFERMKDEKAEPLDEALQRILFWSSLFWQTGHKLIGLGRLDKILEPFANQRKTEMLESLIDFINILHEYYEFKSATLPGDIGQIIILSGKEQDGSCYVNALTYAFIEAIKIAQIPDPKILLRVTRNTPDDLLSSALECIATGGGSPLLSNDEVVIPALLDFGYSEKDVYNYVVSACWEPVSYGNSLEQNNLANINYSQIFNEMLKNEKICHIQKYEDMLELYDQEMDKHIEKILKYISQIKWERDPLFSLFTEECCNTRKDISQGGAIYNNYGILSVGLGNAVNSLINIKKMIFDEKKLTLLEIHEAWKGGRESREKYSEIAKVCDSSFGHDKEETIDLVNKIIDNTVQKISSYRNFLGGKVKSGLSSPNYITQGSNTDSTFDGRKDGEPLSVHISATDTVAYTELVSFASQLHYKGGASNGNVVDFFVTPDFIKSNFDKFKLFIKMSIIKGFFQMQMNVVSSETLQKAKANPDKYPNLIVRVWGFSAYFKDLPEEYQDVLLKRALLNEGKYQNG